ncbi:outer membrane protein assembly factor BamD [Candidatus Neomarinimicrobiota bacterium]
MNTRKNRLIIALLIGGLLAGCAGRNKDGDNDIEVRYSRGMKRFEKGKWLKASEDFNWVVLNNPAGNLAAEAQYYYAECAYQQDQFVEAQLEFERLLRRWASTTHMLDARYRIVQSLVSQSPKYFYDQETTTASINELQLFIDDFPDTEYRVEAEELITQLRFKIAKKYYESGRQYLKWRQSDAARIYLETVIAQYYDTELADEARVGMVISYIIEENPVGAEEYLSEESENFTDALLKEEAEHILAQAQLGKFDLRYLKRLYK